MKYKVNKKVLRRTVSLILVITMLVTGLNLDMMSESIYAAQKAESTEDNPKDEVTVVKELINERTENSNTYLMSDGLKKIEIFPENIRYKEEKEWVNYNPAISDIKKSDKKILDRNIDKSSKAYTFVNISGDSRQFFPKEISKDNGVVMIKGNYTIEMAPIVSQEEKYQANIDNTEITYTGGQGDIEYCYTSLKDGVKEDVILYSKPENSIFSYLINTENVVLKQRKNDKGIQVLDRNTMKVVAYIPAPNMIDGEGNIDYKNVEYKLTKEDNQMILTVSVNEDYFENSELKYPVKIDPYMVWMGDYLTAVGVWSAPFMANSTITNSQLIVSNYLINSYPYNSENRVYIDADKLLTTEAFVGGGNQLSDKYIESASLSIHESNQPAHYPTGTVQVKRVLDEWEASSVTWNNQPNISDEYIAEFDSTGIEGEWHNLDITDWVQNIVSGDLENHGLVLTCPQRGMAATVYGPQIHYITDESGHTTGSRHMTISVLYRDIEKYDATVEIQAEYDSDNQIFNVTVEDANESDSGATISGYKIYARKNSKDKFSVVDTGDDIQDISAVSIGDISRADLRACILYSDGTAKLSNIVSFEKYTETIQDEDGNESTTVSYEQTTFDTDGDGLEDGYEIWDFKTLWNMETGIDEEGNKTYDLDTDDDGFPDSYEVFTLGTNPAVANRYNEEGNEIDSDEDGWTDYKEYQEGTDPWLKDSDFDGTNDRGDSTPRKTNDYTRQTRAAAAKVHIGLYEKETQEVIDGVTYSYIINIYNDLIKQVEADFGNTSLNKTMKYFYDAKQKNTAIIEMYDNSYDPEHTQTICITYTYDSNDNVTFICDQRTKYTMDYTSNGDIANIKVGNQILIDYDDTEIANNSGEDGSIENISVGEIIDQNEHIDKYKNNQNVRTVTTTYKVAENDTESKATKVEVFYNTNQTATYVTELNSEGNILKLEDYSTDEDAPVVWNYSYTDIGQTFTRSDSFTKAIQTSENEQGVNTTQTSYGFKDIKNQNKTYADTVSTSTETKITEGGNEYERNIRTKTLHNADISSITKEDEQTEEKIYSNQYNVDVVKNTLNEVSNTNTTFGVNVDGTVADKDLDYTYDLAGNITEIKEGNDIKCQYSYDAHGRLTDEKDYITLKEVAYDYNTHGNIYGKTEYPINSSGNRTDNNGTTIYYNYNNSDWPDQLTSYNGYTITYDNVGNPLTYIGGLSFAWSRGRQLSEVTLANNGTASYEYNQNGLRTKKVTKEAKTKYEWDEDKLLRETVTYNQTNDKVDVWYLYNADEKIIGFEYSYLNFTNDIVTARVYYEKNLQGDIIGLLDARGVEIASYTYDAWGNITEQTYVEGNEIPYNLNHILYRGYYRDEETGFYYLQSRYYDAEIGRFINADSVMMIGTDGKDIYKDNLYVYCNSNPINRVDYTGEKSNKKKTKFKYNRSDARKYMEKYWNVKSQKHGWWIFSSISYSGYNKRFPYLERGDCTNFASQCLWQGGIPMTWCWYCYNTEWGYEFTHSWSVVLEQREYIKKTIVAKTTRINCDVSVESIKKYIKKNKPQVGDIIYFHAKGKNKFKHTAIISKVKSDKIEYAAHSDSHIKKSIRTPLNGGYYDYVEICHIKEGGNFYV